MRAQRAAFIVVCGVAAATGAGVWVLWSSEPEVLPVERTALAQAPKPAEPVAPELPPPGRDSWVAPTTPTFIGDPEAERAAAEEPRERGGRGDRGDRGAEAREAMMKQFDTDGDGELSDAERQAARAQWEARASQGRQILVRRYDKDGDGELNDAERQAAREEMGQIRDEIAQRIVPQYDLDGDGELNDQERQAAGPAFRAEYERLRTVATLDLDGSGNIDPTELARAVLAVGDGDPQMDLNRDGVVDYRDASYATEAAQGY